MFSVLPRDLYLDLVIGSDEKFTLAGLRRSDRFAPLYLATAPYCDFDVEICI